MVGRGNLMVTATFSNPTKKGKCVSHLFLGLVFLLSADFIWAGTVFYVDGLVGDDSNMGTRLAPWKTIQKAANTMIAGDEVSVAAGRYLERVLVEKSGAPGSMISFAAAGTVVCQGFTIRGNCIRISGFRLTAVQGTWSAGGYGVWLEGANCICENNHFYYCPTGGIITWLTSSSSIIRNNRFERNCLTGLDIRGTNHVVENNEIWGTITHHTLTDWTPSGDANGIQFFGKGHIFRGNYIHDISFDDPETVSYAPHIDGFQTWADANHSAASDVLIEKNRIVLPVFKDGNAKGVAFMLDSCSNITIRNNITFAFNVMNTAAGSCNRLKLENNTFIGKLDFPKTFWPGAIDLQNCPYSIVRNNIIYNQPYYAIYIDGASATGLQISNNCIYNENGITPSGTHYSKDLWGKDPSFVNPAAGDYHLSPGSPCIDTGMTLPDIIDDYDGNSRPCGGAHDIGAYEFKIQSNIMTSAPPPGREALA